MARVILIVGSGFRSDFFCHDFDSREIEISRVVRDEFESLINLGL